MPNENSSPALGDAAVTTKRTATAPIEDAEERASRGRRFLPREVIVYYTQEPGQPWRWLATVEGPMIRKDGSVGTRPIHQWWSERWANRPGDEGPVPPWVLDFVHEHHPDRR